MSSQAVLSLTASGFRDGLGERILTFDRAHGQVLERLRLRPELAAFEAPLGRRFEQLARLDDPRLVRLQALERDEDGRLALLSTYTGGVRASEAIRAAREREIVPDLALGLYVAAETLAALHALHAEGCPHGALALERVALTPEGAVLVADYLFAEALGALRFSPHRLWREFRLVVHNGDSPFTPAADIRQTAFVALAFITGRPLDAGDHESIEAAVSEATEAALIRGGRRLAHPLATWFRRAITGGSPRGFADAAAAAAACDALLGERERDAARAALADLLAQVLAPADVGRDAAQPGGSAFPVETGREETPPAVELSAPTPAETAPVVEWFAAAEQEPAADLADRQPDVAPAAELPALEIEITEVPSPHALAEETVVPAEVLPVALEEAAEEPPAVTGAETPAPEEAGDIAETPDVEAVETVAEPVADAPPIEPEPPAPERRRLRRVIGASRRLLRRVRRERPSDSATGELEIAPAEPVAAASAAAPASPVTTEPVAAPERVESGEPAIQQAGAAEAMPAAIAEAVKALEAIAAKAVQEALAAQASRRSESPATSDAVEGPAAPAVSPAPEPVAAPWPPPAGVDADALPPSALSTAATEADGSSDLTGAPWAPLPWAPLPDPRLGPVSAAPATGALPEPVHSSPNSSGVPGAAPAPTAPAPPWTPAPWMPAPSPPAPQSPAALAPGAPSAAPVSPSSPSSPSSLWSAPPPAPAAAEPPLWRTPPGAPTETGALPPAGTVPSGPPTPEPPLWSSPPAASSPLRLKEPLPSPAVRPPVAPPATGPLRLRETESDRRPRRSPPPVFTTPVEPEERRTRLRNARRLAVAAVFLLVAAIVAATVPWPSGSKAPAPGVLVLESTPPGGEVTIEGRTRGETPVKLELAPGRYEVTVSGHGRSRRLAVEIESGKAVVRRVDLGPERAAVATGSLEIVSQPSGARVLVDGRVRGQTPLLVDELAAGRHVVLVESGSGAVRRTVRVRPGETTRVELSIYSGFLRVTAPLELEVFADGRGIGFAGRDPLLLPPGRHTVELVNELLGYRSTHVVDVAPGEEERLVVRPLGTLNVNALPWAEVWVDGERLGETPIANAPVPLGTREVVFRHPQYGERRVTVTVKAGAPAQATVDFTR